MKTLVASIERFIMGFVTSWAFKPARRVQNTILDLSKRSLRKTGPKSRTD
jgi:hypothetical protein